MGVRVMWLVSAFAVILLLPPRALWPDGDLVEGVTSPSLREMMLCPSYPAASVDGLAITVWVLRDCPSEQDPVLDVRVTLVNEKQVPVLVNPDLCYLSANAWLTPGDEFVRLSRPRVTMSARSDPYRPDGRDLFVLQPGRRLQRDLVLPIPPAAFARAKRMDVVVGLFCYNLRALDARAWEGNIHALPVSVAIHRDPRECEVPQNGIDGRVPGGVEVPKPR